jgi:hypothetical protein
VASADEGMEVRRHEETHDSSHRSRCTDSVSGVRGSGLCTNDEFHNKLQYINDFEQHEQHKLAFWAVPRTAARYAESEHEIECRLPRQSNEARADHVV